MRKIYFIWLVRRIFNPLSIKLFLLGILALELRSYVSLRDIVRNWPSPADVVAQYHFMSTAFFHAGSVTKMVALLMSVLMVALMRDIFRHADFGDMGSIMPRNFSN